MYQVLYHQAPQQCSPAFPPATGAGSPRRCSQLTVGSTINPSSTITLSLYRLSLPTARHAFTTAPHVASRSIINGVRLTRSRNSSASSVSCTANASYSSQLKLSSNNPVTISLTRIPTVPSSISNSRSCSFTFHSPGSPLASVLWFTARSLSLLLSPDSTAHTPHTASPAARHRAAYCPTADVRTGRSIPPADDRPRRQWHGPASRGGIKPSGEER
jgi:hypothetical protein